MAEDVSVREIENIREHSQDGIERAHLLASEVGLRVIGIIDTTDEANANRASVATPHMRADSANGATCLYTAVATNDVVITNVRPPAPLMPIADRISANVH
jgi:alkaline phosphatase